MILNAKRLILAGVVGLAIAALGALAVSQGLLTAAPQPPQPLTLESSDLITRETVDQVHEVTRLGGGTALGGTWSPDGYTFALRGTFGTRIYNVETPTTPRQLDERGAASDLAFSPDGRRLATAADGLIRLWDTTTWEVATELSGHEADISMVMFAPDGKTLIVVDAASTFYLWDVDTWTLRATVSEPGEEPIDSITITPDSRLLAAKREDAILILRVADGSLVETLTKEYSIRWNVPLAFSSDGQWLAAGVQGHLLWKVEGETFTYVEPAEFPDQGLALAMGHVPPEALNIYRDEDIRAWASIGQFSRKSWEQKQTYLPNVSGQYVLLLTDQQAELWNRDGLRLQTVLHWNTQSLWGLSTSPDGAHIAARSYEGLHIWDINAPQSYTLAQTLTLNSDLLSAFWVDGSFKGLFIEEFGGSWRDIMSNTTLQRFTMFQPDAAHGPIYSADHRLMAIGSISMSANIYNLETGHMPPAIRPTLSNEARVPAWPLAFNADGSLLALWGPEFSCGSSLGCASTVSLWDTKTGQQVRSVGVFEGLPRAAVFTADGSRLVIAGGRFEVVDKVATDEGHIEIWDLTTGEKTQTLGGFTTYVESLLLSPDERFVVGRINGGGEYQMWDLASETPRLVISMTGVPKFAPPEKAGQIAFSAQSDLLFVGTDSGSIHIFDTEQGTEIKTLRHGGEITGLVMADEGRALISSGNDGTIRVWRTAEIAPIAYEWTPVPVTFPAVFEPYSSITPPVSSFPIVTLAPSRPTETPLGRAFPTATPWGGTPANSFLTSLPPIPTQE